MLIAIFAGMENVGNFKIWFVIVGLIISVGCVFAQQSDKSMPGNISGRVLFAEDEKPLENATIQLLQGKDSTVVASTASNKSGYFQLKDVKPENYILKVSFISFANSFHNINKRRFSKKEISVPDVMLEAGVESFAEGQCIDVSQQVEVISVIITLNVADKLNLYRVNLVYRFLNYYFCGRLNHILNNNETNTFCISSRYG